MSLFPNITCEITCRKVALDNFTLLSGCRFRIAITNTIEIKPFITIQCNLMRTIWLRVRHRVVSGAGSAKFALAARTYFCDSSSPLPSPSPLRDLPHLLQCLKQQTEKDDRFLFNILCLLTIMIRFHNFANWVITTITSLQIYNLVLTSGKINYVEHYEISVVNLFRSKIRNCSIIPRSSLRSS